MRNLYFYLLLVVSIFSSLQSEGNLQKHYISSSHLQVTDEGLFLYDCNEEWIFVDSVFCDDDGLFILKSKRRDEEANDRCLNGHKIYCTNCWGCSNPWCKGRCKCAEWPFTGTSK